MGGILLSLYFLLLKWFVIIIKAEETNITFPIILNETDMTNFNKKSILRYGFHRTHKCLDFQKTYVCINTCLTRGFAIASADKNCKCTCFKDKIKSKYISVNSAWKLPTTTIPAWVGGYLNPSKGNFVLVHSPHKKHDNLKHQINDPALYGNDSSAKHQNETNEEPKKNDGNDDAGGTTTVKDGDDARSVTVTTEKDNDDARSVTVTTEKDNDDARSVTVTTEKDNDDAGGGNTAKEDSFGTNAMVLSEDSVTTEDSVAGEHSVTSKDSVAIEAPVDSDISALSGGSAANDDSDVNTE